MMKLALLSLALAAGWTQESTQESTQTPTQGEVDNPEYKNWSSFKVGSFTRMKELSEASNGTKLESEITYTLMDLTDRRVVIDIAVVRSSGGIKAELPRERQEIPARIPRFELKPLGTLLQEGDEVVTVGDRRLPCRWKEVREDENRVTRSWTCPQIPGGLVKREVRNEGPAPSFIRLEVVTWKEAF